MADRMVSLNVMHGGHLNTNQSFESESQVVLDVLAPSSQPGGTETIVGSFVDSSIAAPNLPDSTKRDGNDKRFDFMMLANGGGAANLMIKETIEFDEVQTEEKQEEASLVAVSPCRFTLPNMDEPLRLE